LNHSPAGSLLDLSVREFLDLLGSAAPAPGGGAAAALCGALGAALVQMTANLTLGKPKLVEVQDQARDIEARAVKLRQRLQDLTVADGMAFGEVSAAYRMPRATDGQKQARSAAIQKALDVASTVPLETAQVCAAILRLADDAAPILNSSAISDVVVGALLAHAALESAAINVEINIAAIDTSDRADIFQQRLDEARAGTANDLARVLDIGRSRYLRRKQ
jgi:formiminotetrahydrofolate cyclodeaminase